MVRRRWGRVRGVLGEACRRGGVGIERTWGKGDKEVGAGGGVVETIGNPLIG